MKKYILLLFFFIFSLTAKSQSQFEWTLADTANGNASGILLTSTGDYLVTGGTFSFGSFKRALLTKLDSAGHVLWAKTFGYTYADRFSRSFETPEGNYLVSGTVADTNRLDFDILMTKLDTSGAVLWSKQYGNLSYGEYLPPLHTVVQLPDSGFALVGGTEFFTPQGDLLIIRADKNGDTLWTRVYQGIYRDELGSISATADGGFIICGRTNSFDNFIMDIFLLKIDVAGNFQWAKRYGGSVWDEGTGALQTFDGGYAVCGSVRSFSSAGEYDALIFKTDSAGNFQWATSLSDTLNDVFYSIVQTADSGLVAVGNAESFSGSDTTDVIISKVSSLGVPLWSKIYGGVNTDEAYLLETTADGGLMASGISYSFNNGNHSDPYLIRTDADGNSCTSQNVFPVITYPALIEDTVTFHQLQGVPVVNHFPNLINGSLLNDIECLQFTSVNEQMEMEELQIYPNPFSENFSVRLTSHIPFSLHKIKIADILGRDVTASFHSREFNDAVFFTRKKNVPSGIYFVSLANEKNTWKVVKVIAR